MNSNVNNTINLKGVVTLTRENTKTGEEQLWYQGSNIISISGYQWILMKMFGLHLDSVHDPNASYEDMGRDTTLIIPDLNNSNSLQIGTDPGAYSVMDEDISSNHFIQGFMVGTGGSGEDTISSKNTNYSFVKLRNPIPFQQITAGDTIPTDDGTGYLGVLRTTVNTRSFYIKKFNGRPHITHSWWKNGQKWDYVDPVTQNDLGPNAVNGIAKTSRIETYVECEMSLSENDCLSYFEHEGSTQTAAINELGLVAFDSLNGIRTILNKLYESKIKQFLNICFNNNRTEDEVSQAISLAGEIDTVFVETNIEDYSQSNINQFVATVRSVSGATSETIDFTVIKEALSESTNIEVEALYNQSGVYVRETDKFLTHLTDSEFDSLSLDEAQRIKLITYFTFNSLPLQENWRLKINYRIYAN